MNPMTRKELDRKYAPRTRVVVRMTFPNVKAYETHAEEVKSTAERVGASLAVKMA